MKNFAHILIYSSLFFLTACSSKSQKEKDDAMLLMKDSIEAAGPQRMQVSDVKETFTYKGKEYQSSVLRQPDESLPIVNDGQGQDFVDNRITLRLVCGGKQLVERVFTKNSFAELVEANFMKYAILEGFLYVENTPQGIIYAASVGYPQSDLYVPIKLTVTPDGKISMMRDDMMEEYHVDSIG